MDNFSSKLKIRRLELNLTQKQVAEKVGISERQYIRYEMGAQEPRVLIAIKIAQVFQTTVAELFSD